jgi:hypothetical protein
MTQPKFYFVDVFAPRPLSGNPLAVVPDLRGLLVNGYTNVGDRDHGRYLDDPAYYRLWEALSELDVPL